MKKVWWRASSMIDEDEARSVSDALVYAGLGKIGTQSYRVLKLSVPANRVPDRVAVVAVQKRGRSVAAVVVGHASMLSYHDPCEWPIAYLIVHGRRIRRARRWAQAVAASLPVVSREDLASKRLYLRSLVREGD